MALHEILSTMQFLTASFVFLTCVLVAYIGWRMFSIKSYKAAIDNYERSPDKSDWFVKYFLGYVLPIQRSMQRGIISALGDNFISGFYRLAGGILAAFALTGLLIYVYLIVLGR